MAALSHLPAMCSNFGEKAPGLLKWYEVPALFPDDLLACAGKCLTCPFQDPGLLTMTVMMLLLPLQPMQMMQLLPPSLLPVYSSP